MPCQQAAIGGKIAAVTPAFAASRRRKTAAAPRVNESFAPSRGRSDLPVLVGHARSGVPSSVASSDDNAADRINAPQSTTPAGERNRRISRRILTRKRRKEGTWPKTTLRTPFQGARQRPKTAAARFGAPKRR